MAFGFDRHFCLGAHLARIEGQVVVATLAERFPDLRMAGETVERQTNPGYRGIRALLVSF